MSYRNDHDAALARVDALSHELDRTEAERDHLLSELDQLRKLPSRATIKPSKLGVSVLTVTLGMCVAVFSHRHPRPVGNLAPPAQPTPEALEAAKPSAAAPTMPSAPPAVPSPGPAAPYGSAADRVDDATRMTRVFACADRLQVIVAEPGLRNDLRSLRAGCRDDIATLVSHRATPRPVSDLLVRWLALEDQLSPSLAAYNTYILRDPEGQHYRAPTALRDAFEDALRARNAFLSEVGPALHPLDITARPDPLAHAIVEAASSAPAR